MDNTKALALLNECTPLFYALGDQARQEIIMTLAQEDRLTTNEISDRSHLSRPAISHHLKILREQQIVTFEKIGTKRYYSLSIKDSIELLKALTKEVEKVCDL